MASRITPFSTGRYWLCSPPGRARFYFKIVGPGMNYNDKPSSSYRGCVLEIYPGDESMPGARHADGASVRMFSHKHLKKHAVLVVEPDPAKHTQDEHCTVGEDLCCIVCGVAHGSDPCGECGGRGFHRPGCKNIDL